MEPQWPGMLKASKAVIDRGYSNFVHVFFAVNFLFKNHYKIGAASERQAD